MKKDRRRFLQIAGLGGAMAAVPGAASAKRPAPTKQFAAWTPKPYIHWSAHVSLYSAKTRSYMIKKGLNFTETTPYAGVAGDKHRWKNVIEPAMGYFGIPVLELPNGKFISDTTAIIRYLEKKHPKPAMQPRDPVMRALCWLIFNFGTEGLFLEAQHYRWSFDDSAKFAAMDIGRAKADPADIKDITKMGNQFQAMKLARFPDKVGITKETIPAIEQFAMLLFDKLDTHFRHYPYILGGRPSVADAALMEALHAHLGRDVHPATIMKKRAPALFRWTETMNYGHYIVDAELSQVPQTYFDPDNLPDTLMDFLKVMAADFGPQTEAIAKAYTKWLKAADREKGDIITNDSSTKNRQAMGKCQYMKQGVMVKRDAWPDVMNMHQYVLEVVDKMNAAQKSQWSSLMKSIGGEVFLNTPVPWPIVIQKDKAPYQLVLGPKPS
jgi:glutathione S-transferase